jgi:hypothetical protein
MAWAQGGFSQVIHLFCQQKQRQLHLPECRLERSDGVHGVGRKYQLMFRRTLIPLMLVLLAAGSAIAPANAQRGDRGDSPFSQQWDRPQQERVPQREKARMSEVKARLMDEYRSRAQDPGSVRFVNATDMGDVYMIEMMVDGRKITVRVNAYTGR